jgi:hypothetical protein
MSEDIKDIEMTTDAANEPIAGSALKEDVSSVLDSEIDYEFQGKDFGYARTVEELELALDEADAERNDPEKWITPIEFHTRLEDKYTWLK